MQKIIFKTQGTTFMINPEMVMYISAEGSYCEIKLSNGELIRLSKNLKYVMSQFVNVDFLFQIHRSNVVNMKFVEKVIRSKTKQKAFEVVLSSGDSLGISPKNHHEFLKSVKEQIY